MPFGAARKCWQAPTPDSHAQTSPPGSGSIVVVAVGVGVAAAFGVAVAVGPRASTATGRRTSAARRLGRGDGIPGSSCHRREPASMHARWISITLGETSQSEPPVEPDLLVARGLPRFERREVDEAEVDRLLPLEHARAHLPEAFDDDVAGLAAA